MVGCQESKHLVRIPETRTQKGRALQNCRKDGKSDLQTGATQAVENTSGISCQPAQAFQESSPAHRANF